MPVTSAEKAAVDDKQVILEINQSAWRERERKGNVETVEEGKEGRQESRAEWASRYIP